MDFWGAMQDPATSESADVTPAPGALQLFLSVSSMDTMLKDIANVLPSMMEGMTIDLGIDFELGGVEFNIPGLTINDMTIGDASMAFVQNTDNILTTLEKIDVTLNVLTETEGNTENPVPMSN